MYIEYLLNSCYCVLSSSNFRFRVDGQMACCWNLWHCIWLGNRITPVWAHQYKRTSMRESELFLRKALSSKALYSVKGWMSQSYLESLVLKNLLNGHQFSWVTELGLIDHTKRAIPDDLGVGVTDLLRPVRSLSRGRHHCGHFTAIFISCRQIKRVGG